MGEMIYGYLQCALWSSNNDQNYGISDFSPSSLKKAEEDCISFLDNVKDEWLEGLDMGLVGHNFWLNRNRHGSGFWDEDNISNVKYRDRLSDLSESFGVIDIYIGDDCKIYLTK